MRYPNIHPARFLERPNRFVARCLLDGETVTVHVKNTGRCRELLVPNAPVWLVRSENSDRKTAFDLVAVEKQGKLINMDAAAPNAVFAKYARAGRFLPGMTGLRAEVPFGASRFDFCLEADGRRHYVEVKGVTLEEDGVVRFPDAPTLRGVKHLRELQAAVEAGFGAHLVFVIQMAEARWMEPNDATHPAFGQALREAAAGGVDIRAFCCRVTPDSLEAAQEVPIRL